MLFVLRGQLPLWPRGITRRGSWDEQYRPLNEVSSEGAAHRPNAWDGQGCIWRGMDGEGQMPGRIFSWRMMNKYDTFQLTEPCIRCHSRASHADPDTLHKS